MPSEAPLPIEPPVVEGRLHPLTLLFAALDSVRPWIVPALVVLFLRRDSGFGLFGLVLVGPALVAAIVRYVTFTYRIEAGELVVRYGLLSRTERHVPLERVQDLRVEQGLLQRLLGVVTVHVETAGGDGPEASLSVLARSEAERLRALVSGASRGLRPSAGEAESRPETRVVRKLSTRELLLAGLTSTRLASVFVVLGTLMATADDLVRDSAERLVASVQPLAERLSATSGAEVALLSAAGLALLVALACVLSAVTAVSRFHGFTLSAAGEDLHRTYGLLTRRSITLPRKRIQVIEIEETLLRRWLGLAQVRADTAGGGAEGARKAGRDVLLPILPRSEAGELMASFFPDVAGEPLRWRPVSRVAIRRGNVKAAIVLGVLAVAGSLAGFAVASISGALALLGAAHLVNVRRHAIVGHAWEGSYFWTRQGWLKRSTRVVPVRNLQAVEVRQTPFDRRLGLATLVLDTAGQAFTGGGPRVSNVPVAEAREIAARLARAAVQTRFRW